LCLTVEAAKKKLIDYFNSLPAPLDTPYPESEDNITFPFDIYKDGVLMGRISKYYDISKETTPSRYSVFKYDIKKPGTNQAHQRSFSDFKKALDYAFGIKDKENEGVVDLTKDNLPTKEEAMTKGTITVTIKNRFGTLTRSVAKKIIRSILTLLYTYEGVNILSL